RHTVSRLIGAPPGYVGYEEGGQLTEAVRRRPYRVVLFDEVEKAHPDVWNTLLQIMDDGRLTDGHGRTVDFRNAVIIMTSNLGTQELQRPSLGFLPAQKQSKSERERLKSAVERALREAFRPEFLNRVDEIIVFDTLTGEDLAKIVELMLQEMRRRLADEGLALELTEAAKAQLVREGYDPNFGARPLRRTIQRRVENPLAKLVLGGQFRQGETILVDYTEEEFSFSQRVKAEVVE
ncbi:MAG TPA: AAA family ATPase, partial [Dehalococcoidia bacterium]|nr:AAA family ATPase [Dehalococcoidia bacterium]